MESSAPDVADGSSSVAISPPLSDRQNADDLIHLLKAIKVAHGRARHLDALYFSTSILVAISGLVATFVEGIATVVSVVGALWAIACAAGVTSWARREVQRAATLQEMFDVRLYRLPWNVIAAGDPVGAAEVNRLAKRYPGRREELRDYYEDVPPLPHPYDVIACQMLNLAWGARVRRRYARVLLAATLVWSAAGAVAGAVAGLTVIEAALWWYVPSLGAALLILDALRAQRSVAAERERVLELLWGWVRTSGGDLLATARTVQDAILQTRQRDIRVPTWFFERFQATDRADFRAIMVELTAAVGGRSAA